MFTPRQTLIDTAELAAIETELAQLKVPAAEEELTEAEHQEATGILIVRALQNPDLVRRATAPIDLGKYKAIFVTTNFRTPDAQLKVKFVRT